METSLLVKDVPLNQVGSIRRGSEMFDPATGKNVKMSEAEVRTLYDEGGTLSEVKSNKAKDAMEADYVVVQNKQGGSYTRELRASDRVLPYREAYSTLRYKDPHFIIKTTEVKGQVRKEAILTSPDVSSAKQAVNRLQESDTGATYSFRANSELTPDELFTSKLESLANTGRTTQRFRGESLKQFDQASTNDQLPNIQSPLESLKNSIASLAQRVPMREVLADMEARIIDQYKDILPKNDFNQPFLPRNSNEIEQVGTVSSKRAADLRTTVEYYNYLYHGYKNTVDDFWKSGFNFMADKVSSASPWIEKKLRAVPDEIRSPTGWLRGRAFDSYIAASMPFSQWLVQGHMAIATAALFPKYVGSLGLAKDWSRLSSAMIYKGREGAARKLFGDEEWAKIEQLGKEWDKSGLGAGIDKHNMVEAGIDQFIDTGRFGKTKALHKATFGKLRGAGFDVGEYINLSTNWLGTRNKAIEAGGDMSDIRTFDEVRAKTRALTQHMNKAGDMPWNKNSISLVMQFMQSPYKSMTMWMDRGLTPRERLTLGVWHLSVLPLPAYLGYEIVDKFGIEDPMAREVALNGIMGGMFNTVMRATLQDNTSISFQRLTMQDPGMPAELMHAFFTEGFTSAFAELPATSPWIGRNPVFTNLAKETYKFMTPWDDSELDDPTVIALLDTFLQTTSGTRGLSIWFKEELIQERDNRYNNLGLVAKSKVTSTESLFRGLFGMGTTDEVSLRTLRNEKYKDSKEARDDIKIFYKEVSRMATQEGFNIDTPGRVEYVWRAFHLVNKGEPWSDNQRDAFYQELNKDIKRGYAPIFNAISSAANMGTENLDKYISIIGEHHPEAKSTIDWLNSENALKELREGRE